MKSLSIFLGVTLVAFSSLAAESVVACQTPEECTCTSESTLLVCSCENGCKCGK